ncbi:MAG: glycosyltransferase, partial [Actinobacteria bacterium]
MGGGGSGPGRLERSGDDGRGPACHRGRRGSHRGGGGDERSGRPAANIGARLRARRIAHRPIRQGAPRPLRRVRPLALQARLDQRHPADPGRPEFVRDGAIYLVVPVNNASYGFTAASDQHLQMSRMRAVETGRWVVDAAVSGVSAFIDTHGQVLTRTGLFQPGILRAQIRSSTATTGFVRWGDWLPILAIVLVVILFLIPRRRPQLPAAPGPLPASPRTLVVLPTFNERDTIERVIAGVLERPEHPDVLVVDDSSPDGTAELVRPIAGRDGRVRLLERPPRSGLASAYLVGFTTAIREGYDLAVEMDSDLSHDPSELSRLLDAARQHDLTVGSRYVAGGSVTNWSRARVALSRGANAYSRV